MYTAEEIEEAGLNDFRVFLIEVWAHLGLPRPTKIQLDIAHNLQHAPKRFVIEAFRGVGKSYILVAFVLWTLFLDPQKKVMVVSASQKLADDFSNFAKQLVVGMPLLQHLAPGPGQRDSIEKWDVGPATPSKDPSLKSVGITGQLTGSRADIIIPDDIEVPKNSYTFLLRSRLSELVKEFAAVLKPEDDARIVFLGTPQVEDSLYNKLPERGYTVRVWPAEIPKPEKMARYGNTLAPIVHKRIAAGGMAGDPLDPERFDREELDQRLVEYARSGYQLQFMLDTSVSDAEAHPLKLADLLVQDVDPEQARVKLVWGSERAQNIQDLPCGGFNGDVFNRPAWVSDEMAKFTGTVMAIDPSGRGKDETAYAIVRILYSTLFLVACGGFRDGYSEETLNALALKGSLHGVNYVIAERNFGGGMFDQLLRPVLAKHKGGVFDDDYDGWSSGQKEVRILQVLEPLMQSHRLVVDRKVIVEDNLVQQENPTYSLVYQMTRMSKVRGALAHDDRIEAVAMACAYFTDRMDRDKDKAHDAHKKELQAVELKKFREGVFGVGKGGGLRYFSSRHR